MDAKENEKFNRILIDGYEELLKVKPENPQAHFIQYLMNLLPKNFQEADPELYKFYQEYKETHEVQQSDKLE